VIIPEEVDVSIEFDDTFPELVIDPEMIERVLINLITNSIQAMPEGGDVKISASQRGEMAMIRIEDTGTGIPEEAMPKLFQPLFTTKAKGVGLGLAACRRLVEAHGGKIAIRSEVGVGTEVTLEFPMR
jgi:signal transduction histidine kinase